AQHVRAGARVVAREPRRAPVAVLLVLLEQRGVHDVDLGDHRHEDRRGLRQRELHGVPIERLRRVRRHHRGEQRRRALLEREDALHAVAHVLRGDLRAVVEFRAVAELERVREPVGRDRVALGQPRLELGRIVEPAIEAVVEVEADGDASDVEGRVRVHRVVRALVGEPEPGLRGGGRGRQRRDERGEQDDGQPDVAMGHVQPPKHAEVRGAREVAGIILSASEAGKLPWSMQVVRYTDAAAFSRIVTPLLSRAEAENNLPLGICAGLESGPPPSRPPYLATIESASAPVGVAIMTPPYKLVLSAAPPGAPEAVCADLRGGEIPVPGVVGPMGVAQAFAATWGRRTGADVGLERRLRIYQLTAVVSPRPVTGRLRRCGVDDLATVEPWARAFILETRLTDDP